MMMPLIYSCFNSTMVRLKEVQNVPNDLIRDSFNSTMVRLKAVALSCRFALNEFQFHNGSIKSHILGDNLMTMFQFQFHNGSIKR